MARQETGTGNPRQRDNGNWSGYKGQNSQKGWNSTFVNVSLTKDQLAEIKHWCPTEVEMSALFDKLIESDYRITVRQEEDSTVYVATLTPLGDKHANSGFLLSGRGSTALKAVRQAGYKHYIVCDEVWGSYTEARDKNDIDD